MIYFASGANSAGEIMGLSRAGQPIGIAAPEVTGSSYARIKAREALEDARVYGLPLFVDSGAFSAFRRGVPLTATDWQKNLALYDQLADQYGNLLYAVAPDVLTDQQATLLLLEQYAPELSALIDRGVQVIVPLQQGKLSLSQMHALAQQAIGRGDVVWGIPSNAAVYEVGSSSEVVDWACTMRPQKIHLLGIGPGRKALAETLLTLASCAPNLEVSTDSNLLRQLRGRKGRRKPMTKAEDDVRAALASCGVVPGATKTQQRWALSAAVKMAACQRVVLGRAAHSVREATMPTLQWRGYRSGYRAASQVTSGVYVITHRGRWWTAYYGPHRTDPSTDRRRLGRSTTYRQTKQLVVEYEKALAGVGSLRQALDSQLDAAASELSPTRDESTQWVRRMADKIMREQGRPESAAMAIAWAIYCKYKRNSIPDTWGHCKKPPSGYIQKKARVRGARKGAATKKRKKKAAQASATAKARAIEKAAKKVTK